MIARPEARRRRGRIASAVLSVGLLAAASSTDAAPDFLRAAETAQAVVLGRPGPTRAVDRHGRSARLAVDRLVSGALAGSGAARTAEAREIVVAWEDLAPRRTPRLPEGEAVLLVLVPLPGATLWRERFPGGGPLAIAERGQALLRAPDPRTVEALAGWLALDPAARAEPGAAPALVDLALQPDRGLASEAVVRLDVLPGLAAALEGEAGERLSAAIQEWAGGDPARSARLLDLAARRRLRPLRAAAVAVSEGPGAAAPAGWNARAAIDGGLSAETVGELLRAADGGRRAVGVAWLSGADRVARLHARLAEDPDARVRRAALEALGDAVRTEALVARLTDRNAGVAEAALGRIADRGVACQPALVALVDGRDPAGRARAIAALASFPEGRRELVRVARDHEDPRVRGFARLALGRLETDPHGDE